MISTVSLVNIHNLIVTKKKKNKLFSLCLLLFNEADKRCLFFNILRILELRVDKSKQTSDLEVWEFISAKRTSILCSHLLGHEKAWSQFL